MNICSKTTEEDMISLRELAERQKNQRALKIKNRILKQTHNIQLAENLSPITKKLDEVNESVKKIGEVIKESNSEKNQEIVPSEIDRIQNNIISIPNSSNFSISMQQMLDQ